VRSGLDFVDVEIALQRRIGASPALLEIYGITSRPLRSLMTGPSWPDLTASSSVPAAQAAAAPQGDLFARA
jgi:hypothetical protein